MSATRYLKIRMKPRVTYKHDTVEVTMTEGGPWAHYCGVAWCDGGCGLPALVLPGDALRLVGDAVACGAAFQAFSRPWKGVKVTAPSEHVEDLGKRWWL